MENKKHCTCDKPFRDCIHAMEAPHGDKWYCVLADKPKPIKSMKLFYTVTKSTVEVYKLRHTKSFGWADITIDAANKTGRISIASDWGDWQYYWGSCGVSFKEFLQKVSKHYVAGKFGADKWFNFDKTIEDFKLHVFDARKNDYLTQEKAREVFNEILDLQKNCGPHRDELYYMISDKDNLMSFFGHQPEFRYTIEPGFNKFWNELWPEFLEQLKSELLINA